MHPVGTMNEGLNKSTKSYSKIDSIITEILCAQTGVCSIY
jgi:hypothetical protein